MTCSACGGEIFQGDRFCGHCGAELDVVGQTLDDVPQPADRNVAGSRNVSIHHEAASHVDSNYELDPPEPPDGPGSRIGGVAAWRPRRGLVLATLAAVMVASLATFLAFRPDAPDPYSRVNALLAALRDHGLKCPEPDYLDIPTSGAYLGMESVLCHNNLWVYSFPDATSARARIDQDKAAALNPPVGVSPVPYTLVAGPDWFVYPPGTGDPPPDPAVVAAIQDALGGQVETSPLWVSQAFGCWKKVNDAVGTAMDVAFMAGRTVDEAYSGGLVSLGSATPEGQIFSDLFLEQVQLAYQGQPPANFASESAQRCKDHYVSGGG
jgi:hypothetical protein